MIKQLIVLIHVVVVKSVASSVHSLETISINKYQYEPHPPE